MSFTEAIKSVTAQYANFSGRARRSEYWFWYLFTAIVNAAIFVLFMILGGGAMLAASAESTAGATSVAVGAIIILILGSLVDLALILPTLAVSVRRLHDSDRSGFFWFMSLIPFVGWIIMLVLYVQEGTAGPNRFGADPQGAQAAPHGVPTV